jgi:hypothetical protein
MRLRAVTLNTLNFLARNWTILGIIVLPSSKRIFSMNGFGGRVIGGFNP